MPWWSRQMYLVQTAMDLPPLACCSRVEITSLKQGHTAATYSLRPLTAVARLSRKHAQCKLYRSGCSMTVGQ